MNYIQNDEGKMVIAIGAPGSMARVQAERPMLIKKLNALYCDSCECFGRAVDRAIEMIREAGIRSEMETNNLLASSLYSNEKAGSVTALVVAVASSNKGLFKTAYVRNLRQCVKDYPAEYGWPESQVETVAGRMFEAMDKNTANYNSRAFKSTCKELGIKTTRTAINQFWKS